ncbi:uncharacterized protein LOC110931238 [Helianthus annuus]|uniref:uncharacterized protein LOC110931238 n=1 Tax=Helianthus annuus TaxID=4232 RepID=UPI000B9000F9|nr:uncharacterized protein LOC110931238 [Helianthus annuus]
MSVFKVKEPKSGGVNIINYGNNQTGEGFWKPVLAKFLELMDQGTYRDIDSVSSKWRKMSGFVNRFSEEYNKIYSSGRRSGMSDEDVFKKALDVYKSNHGTTFAHVQAWEIIRMAQKWALVPNEVEMAKRQRTSESGNYSPGGLDVRCHINLNDGAEFDEEEYAVKEAYTKITAQKARAKERAIKEKSHVAGEKLRVAGEKIRLYDDKVRLKE